MDWLMFDWQEIFGLTVSPFELVLRGTLIYLGIFAILRLVFRRVAGTVTIADLLMVVLIADAAQNAMAAEYRSVTDGVILVATIIFWNYALDRLAYHFPRVSSFAYPEPLVLVRDGRILRRNLRREFISESELMSQLRENGVEDIKQVKIAHMEGDGRISVIKRQ